MIIVSRHVSALRGATPSCRQWPQEAALRALTRDLDSGVAPRPGESIVSGGQGRRARTRPAGDAIHADGGPRDASGAARRQGIGVPALSGHGGSRR
jgi:urocanate hydratase